MTLESKIKTRALELGFDLCRITSANPPESAAKFESWVQDKSFGEMAWIERNASKRIDPQQVLPGAKSIIALATNYSPQRGRENSSAMRRETNSRKTEHIPTADRGSERTLRPTGVVARYARYSDYHDVLAGPLKTLTQFLDEQAKCERRSLWYVDTGPILERDLAQRAGVGFVGKHTNVISREFGNWIFLSEILTTASLTPDKPEKNRCGTCSQCISACPTNAITEPFKLDARKCISYLTIEIKGSIPVEYRKAIGNRIYGCDDCLAVCPWNRFAKDANLMREHQRKDLDAPDLIELLSLNDEEFKTRFKDSPIYRTKRRGLLRNVCVALGNTGDPQFLPALGKAKNDPEPLIAEHAQWAIEEISAQISQEVTGERVT